MLHFLPIKWPEKLVKSYYFRADCLCFHTKAFLKDVGSAMELIKISEDKLEWHKKFHKKSKKEGRCVERAVVWANRKATWTVSEF